MVLRCNKYAVYRFSDVTDFFISWMHQEKKPRTSDSIQKLARREKEMMQLIA
jgi:hypothetical protein